MIEIIAIILSELLSNHQWQTTNLYYERRGSSHCKYPFAVLDWNSWEKIVRSLIRMEISLGLPEKKLFNLSFVLISLLAMFLAITSCRVNCSDINHFYLELFHNNVVKLWQQWNFNEIQKSSWLLSPTGSVKLFAPKSQNFA